MPFLDRHEGRMRDIALGQIRGTLVDGQHIDVAMNADPAPIDVLQIKPCARRHKNAVWPQGVIQGQSSQTCTTITFQYNNVTCL